MASVFIKQLKKDYDLGKTKVHALKCIDLNINKGEFVTLVEPSGSGKTMLLNLICCLDYPSSGEV